MNSIIVYNEYEIFMLLVYHLQFQYTGVSHGLGLNGERAKRKHGIKG